MIFGSVPVADLPPASHAPLTRRGRRATLIHGARRGRTTRIVARGHAWERTMSNHSTLQEMQSSAGASFMPYGPPEAEVRVVETFGEYEAEYAAIRKGAALFPTPHRGLVRVRGADRVPFVHQLISNEARDLPAGGGCRVPGFCSATAGPDGQNPSSYLI